VSRRFPAARSAAVAAAALVSLAVVAALLGLAPGSARADSAGPDHGRIDLGKLDAARIDAAFAEYDKPGSPGCAIGVVESGTIVFARGYGSASLEHEVPITPRTLFDLGSTSKQITSAAVALLALDGRLSLDDDMRKYLPEIRPMRGARAISVRRLLDHTSGLRDYTDLLSMQGYSESDLTTTAQAFAILSGQRGRNFPAGAEFRYTNSGHFLASILVQRVSGKSLRDFARERIFDPLGMKDSTYFDDHTLVVPRRAAGYSPKDGGGFEVAMSDWEQVGDGGVQSSIEEMALWATNLDTGDHLGGQPLIDLLHTPGTLADGTPIPYGLGLFFDTHRGLKLVEHGGAWAGYRANLMRVPERRLAVITLCNISTAATNRLSLAAIDAALDGLPESQRPLPGKAPGTPAAADNLASYAGRYVSEHLGEVLVVEVKADGLEVAGTPLIPQGSGRFATGSGGGKVTFSAKGEMTIDNPGDDPRPVTFRRLAGEANASARGRTAKPAPTAAARAELLGTYRNDDMTSGCEVTQATDRIEFSCGGGEKTTMTPIDSDLYDLGWGLLRTHRSSGGAVDGLALTSRGLVDFTLHRVGGPAARGEGRGTRGV
jgi:CubicO group peptidase (beta-lactamase class C family)